MVANHYRPYEIPVLRYLIKRFEELLSEPQRDEVNRRALELELERMREALVKLTDSP